VPPVVGNKRSARKKPTLPSSAPWRPQLERLFDAYLRLRPEIRARIDARAQTKRDYRAKRRAETLVGLRSTERVLVALAAHGPITRARLRSITLLTHQNTALRPLIDAGILATETRIGTKGTGTRAHGTRRHVVVGLNAAFPVSTELRALLLALAEGTDAGRTLHPFAASSPRSTYDVTALFTTAPLLWALLMMNAVPGREIDVASLHRLRPQHAAFTIHGRMHWLLEQGLVKQRRQGLVIYYGLNPEHRLYSPLKRLLDRIGKVWPDLVAAAKVNDDLKPARRLVQDRNARRPVAK